MRREDRRATALAMVVLGLAVLLPLVLSANSEAWYKALFFDCGLLAHEVGHRVAMHRHGQRRPWLFFATLFGARHPVHAPGASRVEIFWLHAMPSLWGVLFGGLLLVLVSAIYWLPELLWFALGLVVFSFLALLPLPLADGGRILRSCVLPTSASALLQNPDRRVGPHDTGHRAGGNDDRRARCGSAGGGVCALPPRGTRARAPAQHWLRHYRSRWGPAGCGRRGVRPPLVPAALLHRRRVVV